MLKDAARPYSYRYIGALCPDFHRTLMYGGVWCVACGFCLCVCVCVCVCVLRARARRAGATAR